MIFGRVFIPLAATLAVAGGIPTIAAASGGRTAVFAAPLSSCTVPIADAALSRQSLADYPFEANGVTGTSVVQVDLSAAGRLHAAKVAMSSGNWFLDNAALTYARRQRYSAEIVACQAVAGSYLIAITFA